MLAPLAVVSLNASGSAGRLETDLKPWNLRLILNYHYNNPLVNSESLACRLLPLCGSLCSRGLCSFFSLEQTLDPLMSKTALTAKITSTATECVCVFMCLCVLSWQAFFYHLYWCECCRVDVADVNEIKSCLRENTELTQNIWKKKVSFFLYKYFHNDSQW